MKKIAVVVFTKISGNVTSCVEKAFYKAVFLHLSNYFENAVYGTVIDLPDSPCYKSYGDREITESASRCYGSLPKEYRDSFFVMVRARRYNVKHSKNAAFCCENGALGALNNLLSGNAACCFTLGNVPESFDYLYFSACSGAIEAGGIKALLDTAVLTGKNVFPLIKNAPYYNTEKAKDAHKGLKESSIIWYNSKGVKEGALIEYSGNAVKGRAYIRYNEKSLKKKTRAGYNNKTLKNTLTPEYGSKALKNTAKSGEKMFFNIKKRYFNTDKKEKPCFSTLEGIYIRENTRNLKEKSIGRGDKKTGALSKGDGVFIKSVYVLNLPQAGSFGDKEVPFKRKKNFSRAAYRAALAASRVYTKILEKSCVSVTSAEEAAECLIALVAMRAFNFLGEQELLENSEALLDIIDREAFIGYKKGSEGKLLFMLTALLSAYSFLAPTRSAFWPLVLQVKSVCSSLKTYLSSTLAETDNIYLIMCLKNAVSDINKKYYIRGSMEAMLSENENDIFVSASDIRSTDNAFRVLVAACNVCFCGNIKDFLLSSPVFRAKSSYLARMDREKGIFKKTPVDKRVATEVSDLLLNRGLSPVKERLTERGVSSQLISFVAYFQKEIRQMPINNDNKVVKICYIVEKSTSLLDSLIRASAAVPEIQIYLAFDSTYAFNKAKKRFGDRVVMLLCEDREGYDEVRRLSSVVRRITWNTTLSELMQGARERGRFKANVKAFPSVFSHSLCAGGDLKNGFCTFFQSGKNVSYGEFIKNPFTEISSVLTTFVPKLRVKLIKVTLADMKYRGGTRFFLLTERGEALEPGESAELSNGEMLTVLRHFTEDGVLFSVQVFKNEKEKEYLKNVITERGFFESCEADIKNEIKSEQRQCAIFSGLLGKTLPEGEKRFFIPEMREIIGREVPRSFFSKIIFLSLAGELKGERLFFAAKRYAEEFSDRKIFDICIPAAYTRSGDADCDVRVNTEHGLCDGDCGVEKVECRRELGDAYTEEKFEECNLPGIRICQEKSGERTVEEGKELKKEYRYPFYIHCLDRVKGSEKIERELFEIKNGKGNFCGGNQK